MSYRLLVALSAVGVSSSFSQAFVMIEDFSVGEHHAVIDWPKNSYAVEQNGLDTAHSVFGRRTMDLTIQNNFNHVPIHLDLAAGMQSVSYSSHSMATTLYTGFGFNGNLTVDFSAEDTFFVDVFTQDPARRFADEWSIYVMDKAGKTAFNGFWLGQGGSIYFRKSDFDGASVDWGQIKYMRFTQEFSFGSGTIPVVYGATNIYAVPEPSVAIIAFGLCSCLRARRARRRP